MFLYVLGGHELTDYKILNAGVEKRVWVSIIRRKVQRER